MMSTNILTDGLGASWECWCAYNNEAADRFSPTELVQPRTWRATSATQSCSYIKASALARAAARETTPQHTATVPET